MLSEQNLKEIEELRSRYPTSRALTLPALWLAQEQFGWISIETMNEIARLLDLPPSHVYGVASFYTMFHKTPVGKYHLQVCTNVSCQLQRSESLTEHICRKLNIKPGETTQDKKFTLTEVECLGSCGTAPVMQVNNSYHENLTIEKLDALLTELK